MLTVREARQRLSMSGMTLSRVGSTTEFRVSFAEASYRDSEKAAYYSDDIEDAMLTGLDMRRRKVTANA